MKLMDKVAVVTGSASGIGRAIALSFAREGADVAVVDINLAGAEAVVKEAEGFKRRAMAVEADVSNHFDVERMVETVIRFFGKIDILVNNAGIIEGQSFLEIPEESWDRVLAVNLKSCFLCGQTVAREMVKRKAGRIINISSSGSERVYPRRAQYAASKGGVNSLTRAMAFELAPYNIHVNAIAPGPTLSPNAKKRSDEFIESRRRAIPLGRHGKPENIAEAAVFLASESSDFVTGHILYVDGGISAVHAVHILTGI